MMSAASGPPATYRGNENEGNSVLQRVLGSRSNDCRSAINSLGLLQQPSTADPGLFRKVFSRAEDVEVSALTASTQAMNVDQAFSKGTGLPRHITKFASSPAALGKRSRWAK